MASFSFASAPQIAELDDLAKKRSGLSTNDCDIKWCCPCNKWYPPIKNLLVNLPHFCCDSCLKKNPTVHSWKIPDTVVQGVSLEFMIYDQKYTDSCVMYASVAAMDCARRVRGAMCGVSKCAAFDVARALKTYWRITGFECGRESYDGTFYGNNIPCALNFLKNHGVPYSRGEFDPPLGYLKLKDYFEVPKDTCLMKRLIASGYPLVAGIRVGALFNFVNNNDVYICPTPEYVGGHHAIALIGCGTGINKKGEAEAYFVIRDSNGCIHSDYQKQSLGGDMLIWESDLLSVWGFCLEDEELDPEDVEELESEDEDLV